MKRIVPVLLTLLCSVSIVSAQLFQARLVSSAYGWQRFDTVGVSSAHLFGHQTMQLSLATESVSLHSYMQGYNDFQGPLKNDPQFRLYNLYIKGSDILGHVDVSVGRLMVFAGVGNGTIDGGVASLKFFDSKIKLTGYYGFLPPPRYAAEVIRDGSNNLMTGSQLIISAFDFLQASASYMQKRNQPESYNATRRDSLFNPYIVEIKPSSSAEEYVSGDVNIEYEGLVSAFARYDYDLLLDRTSRFQIFTRVKPLDNIGITAEYLRREPRLSYNSIFWVFAYNSLQEWELGAEYALTSSWQIFGRFGSLSYGDENSNRITAGINGRYISFSVTRNAGYGGEISAASMNAAYPLLDNTLTPTFLLSYAQYKLNESATKLDGALSVGAGAVFRPFPTLSLDTQMQWIQNKIYKNDMRVFVRASYFFREQLNFF